VRGVNNRDGTIGKLVGRVAKGMAIATMDDTLAGITNQRLIDEWLNELVRTSSDDG
jgi:hypothetical protein